VREQLVAWAEDCRVQGEVDLGEGRLSDVINELDIVVFRSATLVALRDGHIVREDEVEVARRELTLIEVEGRRGDPLRRLRTIAEHVRLEVDPFRITGDLHHLPSVQSLNALTKWSRFIPVTDALVEVDGSDVPPTEHAVVLVNRDRIRAYHLLHDAGPAWAPAPVEADELVGGDVPVEPAEAQAASSA